MKHLLILGLFVVATGATKANAYDKYDVQVCETTTDSRGKLECYRDMNISKACAGKDIAAEIGCYQAVVKQSLAADVANSLKAEADRKPALAEICRAGIAATMGRDPKIVHVDEETDGMVILSYRRQDDNSLWQYRCKVSGNRLIWASKNGRWRTEDKITYQINDLAKNLTISELYSDGSAKIKQFSYSQLFAK